MQGYLGWSIPLSCWNPYFPSSTHHIQGQHVALEQTLANLFICYSSGHASHSMECNGFPHSSVAFF